MCSVAMPADYDVLLAHGPPIFSHSPPVTTSEFLANYSNFHVRYEPPFSRPYLRRRTTPPPTLPFETTKSVGLMSTSPAPIPLPAMAPRRPCLVIRPDDASSSDETDLPSPTRLKKKVVFADDKGLSLTEVRVMTEPSNVPPVWSLQFLAQVTRGISAEVAPEPWELTFPQPASDYLDFRHRLDTGNVSLENVIVRESEDIVVGTVKVRNISFHKEVFVRLTSDKWATHEDAFCTYVENNVGCVVPSTYVLYDTFSFRLTLPPRSRCVEFCVCFRGETGEFWDNNGGKNYVMLKKPSAVVTNGDVGFQGEADAILLKNQLRRNNSDLSSSLNGPKKCSDALHAGMDSWSEFASWNHLDNSSPYW
uniref:CBM21 domain-containing protein n=1 Tax=Timema poppense TaxID=170557 RepID=A0A7R9D413_TIMPO|nr:unnamed protein product [Timema poppensis]